MSDTRMIPTSASEQVVDLRAKPYRLDDEGIRWVEDTLAGMDTETRLRHVFAPLAAPLGDEALRDWVRRYRPGAIMLRPGPKEQIRRVTDALQAHSPVPLLVAGNLEDGGSGLAEDGTVYGRPLQVAAAGSADDAYELGRIAGVEAAAVGGNWAFAPIVDIDYNWRNPITNVRTFGSDPDTVLAMGAAYQKGFESAGGIVSVKHFPGDGTDERDQHLHVTFNLLDTEAWRASYGCIYRELIERGAHTVMVGHIAFPAYSRSRGVEDGLGRSAVLAPELLQDLLRGELNFNGLIVTDATPMVGFAASGRREDVLPEAFAAGCDMLLFNRDYAEDLAFMRSGLERGVYSAARLEDAVRRILGVKASMKLHRPDERARLYPSVSSEVVGGNEHLELARRLAERSITLVRDRERLLPLAPERFRRLFLMPLGAPSDDPAIRGLAERLERAGFEVDTRDVRTYGFDQVGRSLRGLAETYDLAMYVIVERTYSNRTQVRVNYSPMVAVDAPWFSHEVPSLAVSLSNPYHLMDMPFISTYINAYSDTPATLSALVAQLTGEQPFRGGHPVDAYCGDRWELRLYDDASSLTREKRE